jgi:hypothetical protein
MSIKLPNHPESNHPLIHPLLSQSDQELVELIRQHPEQGRYFTALFCRYSDFVYTLFNQHASFYLQVDYLFAQTWRNIFQVLTNPERAPDIDFSQPGLLNLIADQVAARIVQEPLPPVASIHYSLSAAPPPLWCYLEASLDHLPPETRLIMVMAQTFHWSVPRIIAYLESEGQNISPAEVQSQIEEGYGLLQKYLPEDICEIYLSGKDDSPALASQFV